MWPVKRDVLLAFVAGAVLSCVVLVSISIVHSSSGLTKDRPSQFSEDDKIVRCMQRTSGQLTEAHIDFADYEKVWRLCGNEVYNTMLFADFEIRRDKFVQQEFDERINLWMVVAITLSGVFLAGLQLLMSYRLAMAGKSEFAKDTQLLAEQGKISFQSSVTGLVILLISLAFFVVYVKWIYTNAEFQIERPDNLVQRQAPPVFMNAGLGHAPTPAAARTNAQMTNKEVAPVSGTPQSEQK